MNKIDTDKDLHTSKISELPEPSEVKRINLTQHEAQPDQGCFEPEDKAQVQELLTFSESPSTDVIQQRAKALAEIAVAHRANHAMIGGALWLMAPLANELEKVGVIPQYSFSERRSVDQVQPDGSTKTIAVHKHLGWVKAII